MLLLDNITDDPLQSQTFILPDGEQIRIKMKYTPMQYGWFIKELTYNDFLLSSLRITNSPNMLHQYRNQIPFGLACISTAKREPTQIEDFSSGASKLYFLTEEEVAQYTSYLSGS